MKSRCGWRIYLGVAMLALAALLAGPVSVWAAPPPPAPPKGPPNIIEGTAASNYIEIPDLHLVVSSKVGPPFRVLDVDIWIECYDKSDATALGNQKKPIFIALKEAARPHDWTEYLDPDTGAEMVKKMVRDTLRDRFPDIQVEDVLLQSMIIH